MRKSQQNGNINETCVFEKNDFSIFVVILNKTDTFQQLL